MRLFYCLLPALLLLLVCRAAIAKPKVLIFCKTAGFHHQSIKKGIEALQLLGRQNKFGTDTTTDASLFTWARLKHYKAVIFLNTTGNVLNDAQQAAFQHYIRSGKGFVGIHAATDTEHDWPWYGQLAGAYFSAHPAIQQATLHVVGPPNALNSNLPLLWTRTDEWYNFKWISDKIQVVLSIDENSYTGGKNGPNHPMSWYHEFEGSRVFVTALGHTDDSYADPLFLQHVLAGIRYALGRVKL